MRSKANNANQLLDEAATMSLLAVPERWNPAEDGSNALVLPGNKKNKLKMQLKKEKKKEHSTMSKSKERKLRQLEEEKRNKLLQAKSIKILEKHKICDSAYSLLHSSGTIGQVETFKERRLRTVQLSKADLQVPEDTFSFKGKDNQNVSCNNEASLEVDPEQSLQDGICVNNSILPEKCNKIDDGSTKMVLDVMSPSLEAREKNASSCSVADQIHSSTILGTHDGLEVNVMDNVPSAPNEKYQEINSSTELTVQEQVNRATVVHVSQPDEKLYAEQQEKILEGATISPENMLTQLRLVLMSATLQVEDFVANNKLFDQRPPVLEVPVRQFPVTIHFSKKIHEDYLGQAYRKVLDIHKRLPPGGILVFVTGQREVEFLCKKLQNASQKLTKRNSIKQVDNVLGAMSETNMKEIDEAFEIENDLPRFSSYEDDNNLDAYSDFTSSGSDSDLDSERENEDMMSLEGAEKTGLVLDFGSLSTLKASFSALSGSSSSEPSCRPELSLPSLPPASDLESYSESSSLSASSMYVLPLYAMLPASAQLRVFEEVPEGERLVVVATNVAETSLTIPGIKYVVDTGKEKVKNYIHSAGMATYEVCWISKASATQRAGRAGRTAPGHCYRLYSSAAFSKDEIFPKFSCPEISKVPVDGIVLLMKSMGIDKVANFPFPSPPNSEALSEAGNCLRVLEALDMKDRLTPMGRATAQYPMSPRHSRMLLMIIKIMKNQKGYARANLVLGNAIAAAAALSFPNPFVTQFEENHGTNNDFNHEESLSTDKGKEEKQRQKKLKTMGREARARFCNPSSDALTVAYALQLFELEANPVIFCRDNSLHLKTMDEMSKLRKQLLQLVFHNNKFCEEFSWSHGTLEDVERSWKMHSDKKPLQMLEEELIAQSICAGWADRVAKRIRKTKDLSEGNTKVHAVPYQSCALKDTVYLHRRSSVSRSAPEFLVYTELLQTKRPYMYGVTTVKSDWLVKYASSLCTFSAPLTDPKPYYEPLSDQVLCWVSPTFGKHNWQLPLHGIPINNAILRLSVFAAALLEGNVLPCLRSVQKFLVAPPSSILRPEALCQRRVGDLLNKLKIGSQTIHSRAMLRDTWSENPQFLRLEIISSGFRRGFIISSRNFGDRCTLKFIMRGVNFSLKGPRKKGRPDDNGFIFEIKTY
ncbi:hypothetical protein Cni_G01320 [Canna indica]|uniref:Helicase C-terminal domain-containing protein n=1 Tax=Canna indica TaxID=4628 RepID=A0AAQ3JMB2_9LILI|nr:hypothetical protein Cni_G01320 [Canna indica]